MSAKPILLLAFLITSPLMMTFTYWRFHCDQVRGGKEITLTPANMFHGLELALWSERISCWSRALFSSRR